MEFIQNLWSWVCEFIANINWVAVREWATGLAITLGSSIILYFVKKLAEWVKTKLPSKYDKLVERIEEVIETNIKAEQQIVDTLKKQNRFDGASQEYCLKECIKAISSQLTNTAKDYITKNYVDLESYLKTKVESYIQETKK